MLSVAQINVRSLHNNFDLLKDHLQNKNYDILGVTETWLNGDISDEVSEINNYTFIRQDRLLNAGGVGIYIKNGLHFSVILQECKPFIEHIWIKITQNHNVLIMGIIYRPPGSSHREFLDYFEDLLPQFYAQSGKIVFLGDFNIDQLDVNFSYTSQLNNIFESFDIKQLVNEPTRVTDRTSTLIDLICSSFDGVFDVENLDINISDHFLTCCKIKFDKPPPNNVSFTYRALSRINFEEFQRDLEGASLHNLYLINDIDEKVTFLTNTLLGIFDKHAPLRTCTNKQKPYCPWITDNIRLMQKMRNQALNRYRRSRNPEHWNYYKQIRNLTTSTIRREKKIYLNNKLQNCNVKEKWNELRKINVLNRKQNHIPDNLKDVNKLNQHFTAACSINQQPSTQRRGALIGAMVKTKTP
ncbi:uncharacterized protein LOC126888543 [Diabrotica virgifera virgifera]|uniref:Endonuclease/exonuclease/phosphatase domain-containing protein n=1 Tax=Diabrotica virgifera virgifera TaxID=50390 RepID=A0ABM5KRN4_DIAVI|nr:uncharacterized protein LOC126888543 [Diabrotica virgifera virgifera]